MVHIMRIKYTNYKARQTLQCLFVGLTEGLPKMHLRVTSTVLSCPSKRRCFFGLVPVPFTSINASAKGRHAPSILYAPQFQSTSLNFISGDTPSHQRSMIMPVITLKNFFSRFLSPPPPPKPFCVGVWGGVWREELFQIPMTASTVQHLILLDGLNATSAIQRVVEPSWLFFFFFLMISNGCVRLWTHDALMIDAATGVRQ